jgi:glucokinase
MYLAGDIGGTKTVLALFESCTGGIRPVCEASFASHVYATFELVLSEFFKASGRPELGAACFGVAGAVVEGRSRTTNLPWVLEESALAEALGTRRVKLLNDLEATAYGMLHLRPDELAPLNPDAAPRRHGNAGVIAAGTGLGEAILYWDGEQYHPIASEGGHGDFGPRSDLEIELLQYLRGELGGHVSYERVLSGPGLHNVYEFLRDRGHAPETPEVAERMKTGDPNATISELGLTGRDALCSLTLDVFCAVYGAEAGNLALRSVAVGGLYVGGGIAPKILPALRRGGFMKSFAEKGRFTEFLKAIEVNVALNPRAALLGAGYFARRLGEGD